MNAPQRFSTTLSTKGQVILPKAIREHRHWRPGSKLTVEDTPDGVLLKAAPIFPQTDPEDVYGRLHREGMKSLSLEEMDEAIRRGAKRRARD